MLSGYDRRFFIPMVLTLWHSFFAGIAKADFQWQGDWQPSYAFAQSPPDSVATAGFGSLTDSTTTATAFATENGLSPTFAQNAAATINFSRAFQLSNDINPTTLTLNGAAYGTLGVNFPVPGFGGNGLAIYSLQLGIDGVANNLISLSQTFQPPTPTSMTLPVSDSQMTSVLLSDGNYTLRGQIVVNAVKTSGLTVSTADFSGLSGFSFGVNPVPEPSSIGLLSFGLLIGAARLRKQRRGKK